MRDDSGTGIYALKYPTFFLPASQGKFRPYRFHVEASRHSGEGRGALQQRSWSIHASHWRWIPAFAGMTTRSETALSWTLISLPEQRKKAGIPPGLHPNLDVGST
jgi:hypothetical protein